MHNPKFDDHRDKLYRINQDKFINKPELGEIFIKNDPTLRKKLQK
jgi:hypothetical protein